MLSGNDEVFDWLGTLCMFSWLGTLCTLKSPFVAQLSFCRNKLHGKGPLNVSQTCPFNCVFQAWSERLLVYHKLGCSLYFPSLVRGTLSVSQTWPLILCFKLGLRGPLVYRKLGRSKGHIHFVWHFKGRCFHRRDLWPSLTFEGEFSTASQTWPNIASPAKKCSR